MKSKKKILLVILTLMVLAIASITIYYFNARNHDKLNSNVNSTEKVENTNVDSETLDTEEIKEETEKDADTEKSVEKKETESTSKKNNENKNESSGVENSKKNNTETTTNTKTEQNHNSNNTQSNQDKESGDEVIKESENKQEVQKEETNSSTDSNINNNDSNNTSNNKNNETSNSGVWDELGITEYDYYNSPMWSWAKVTHKTKAECISAGETAKAKELEKDESERKSVLFTCTEIYSYSGNYLGEMLEIEYLG